MVSNPKTVAVQTPPLQQGDHLTRAEFERRYSAMPQIKKAELIEGIVQMPSPVRYQSHGSPHIALAGWVWHYCMNTPGVGGADNATVRLDLDNEPQPDALIIREPSHGGRVVIGTDDYLEGAPELVAEIAASTVSIDLHTKLRIYRRNQVQEYIVWRVEDAAIDWFVLQDGEYVPMTLNAEGVYQSVVFPGLWLDHQAMVTGDAPRVLRVLQNGLASPEHQAFVDVLRKAAEELKKRDQAT